MPQEEKSIIRSLLDPTIALDEMSYEDIEEGTNEKHPGRGDKESKNIGNNFPMIIINDYTVSEEEIERVCNEVPVPIHYNRTGVSPMISKEKLEAYGVKMVSNATGALRTTARAIWDYMYEFQERDVSFVNEFLEQGREHPTGDLHAFVGFSEIKSLEKEFLPSKEVTERYQGSLGFQP